MRWSLISSTSLIPGASLFAMLKVTGPAGTLPLSTWQESLPASLAMVMLTAVTPLAPEVGAARLLLLPALVLVEPHAAAATTTAAIRTGRTGRSGLAGQPLRDGNLVSLRCFPMLVLFPFGAGGGAVRAQGRKGKEGREGREDREGRKDEEHSAKRQHRRQPRRPQQLVGARL